MRRETSFRTRSLSSGSISIPFAIGRPFVPTHHGCRQYAWRKFTPSRFFGILTEEHHENLASTDHSPEQLTDHALLRDALHTLSVRSREALILYEIADLSISEIQKIQGGTASAIKVRLMRARRLLQQRLGASPLLPEHQPVGAE
ncbi:MAG: sigma-70 family RNA polymerase sigma factor [Ignavibacteria bacterium]|nr:sigma-70 family RNA polymerase sigma factor [Ignavibacteria bacterium]